MKIPFLDLKALHEPIRGEIAEVIADVIDNSAFAGGPYVERFEQEYASFCGCSHGIGVGSGTEALWLTLLALGVGQGDEVITVPNTFIATAEAISFCGATPVFVDIDEQSYTMNPKLLEMAITSKTKGIIPVHLFGQMADMDPIMDVARKYGLFVVEDACQAHGAEYKGRTAGSIGDAGCFSFYPGKNLGAMGEAGAVITNRPELAHKIKILRDHGQIKKYEHEKIGWNGRMDGIQGAVLSVKLKYLPDWNAARRRNAQLYNEMLAGAAELTAPAQAEYGKHVYHVYAVRLSQRDRLLNFLAGKGIGTGIHYPNPVHVQKAYGFLGLQAGLYPVSEKCASEFLSLPMFPDLDKSQICQVVENIKSFLISQ